MNIPLILISLCLISTIALIIMIFVFAILDYKRSKCWDWVNELQKDKEELRIELNKIKKEKQWKMKQ